MTFHSGKSGFKVEAVFLTTKQMKNVHHVIWYSKLKSRKKQHEGSLNDHSGNSKTDSDSASNKGYQQHLAVTLVKRHQLSLSYSLSAITLYSHFTVLRYSFNNMHMISYLKTSHSKDFCRISQWLRLAGTSGGHCSLWLGLQAQQCQGMLQTPNKNACFSLIQDCAYRVKVMHLKTDLKVICVWQSRIWVTLF